MLHEFIAMNREEIIRRCREKVAMRSCAVTEYGSEQNQSPSPERARVGANASDSSLMNCGT
jgi:hypothetical protein